MALMGALASAHNQTDAPIYITVVLLVLSATCSTVAIGLLARLSFQAQFTSISLELSVQRIRYTLILIWGSVALFILALSAAALELWL